MSAAPKVYTLTVYMVDPRHASVIATVADLLTAGATFSLTNDPTTGQIALVDASKSEGATATHLTARDAILAAYEAQDF